MHIHGTPKIPEGRAPNPEEAPSKISAIASKALLAIQSLFKSTPPSPLAPIKPVRARESLIDYDAIYKEAIDLPAAITSTRPADIRDPGYLLFIARQRKNLGIAWNPSCLRNMPLDPLNAYNFSMLMGGLNDGLTITPTDIMIYAVLCSKFYHAMVRRSERFLENQRQFSIQIYEAYETSLVQDMRNLATFCGVGGYFQGTNLEGNFPFVSYKEISNSIQQLTSISSDEKAEYEKAFENAGKLNIFSPKTIERIKDGTFVTIPVGFIDEKGSHHVDLLFCNDEFIICNRGSRAKDSPTIVRYTYDKEKLNPDVIKYLVYNHFIPCSDSSLGMEHQHLYLYTILPLILEGKNIEMTVVKKDGVTATFYSKPRTLSIQSQKVGNCTKASPVTAFKMGVYLNHLKRGYTEREASWFAKLAGDELSTLLRMKMINRIKNQLPYLSSSTQDEIAPILSNAHRRLVDKRQSASKRTSLRLFLPTDLELFISSALAQPTDLKRTLAKDTHHPLLLLIARNRKSMHPIIGLAWIKNFLPLFPISPDEQKSMFQKSGGFRIPQEDPLYIEIEDFKIFSAIVTQLEKYPEVLKKMGF